MAKKTSPKVDMAAHFKELKKSISSGLPSDMVKYPDIPQDSQPIHKVIQNMSKNFQLKQSSHFARKWMTFGIDTNQPIGLNVFGDPHLDDDGCNWPLLLRHIDIMKKSPGMFGCNIGDSHNNWVGRLMKEYANQESSRDTAWRLIEWFFRDSGINWLLILAGNHDGWNFGNDMLKQMTKNLCTMVDWRAQFKLRFKNGREALCDFAHDHPGQSQWNPLHAQQKASAMGGVAHWYLGGHRHTWGIAQHECPHTGRVYWISRARGYKFIDHYAENLGFGSQKQGASITAVINPQATRDSNLIQLFADTEEAADFLKFLRKKYK